MDNNQHKILIINYFLSSEYNSYGKIKRWLDNTLKNLLTECKRKIIIVSDNIEAIKQLSKEYNQDFLIFDYYDIIIDHYYYLCIKYHIMLNCLLKYKDNYDYICFCQSNFMALNYIPFKKLLSNNQEIQLLLHPDFKFNKESFLTLYGNNKSTSVDINNIIDKYDNSWRYYQSGFSTFKIDMFLWLYNEINNRMLLDFYNNKRVVWHDETYLNYIVNGLINDKSIINVKHYSFEFGFLFKNNLEYKEL